MKIRQILLYFLTCVVSFLLFTSCKKDNKGCMPPPDPIDTIAPPLPCTPLQLGTVNIWVNGDSIILPIKNFRLNVNHAWNIAAVSFSYFPHPIVDYEFLFQFYRGLGVQQLQYSYYVNSEYVPHAGAYITVDGDQGAGYFNLDTTYQRIAEVTCLDTLAHTVAGKLDYRLIYHGNYAHFPPFKDTMVVHAEFNLTY